MENNNNITVKQSTITTKAAPVGKTIAIHTFGLFNLKKTDAGYAVTLDEIVTVYTNIGDHGKDNHEIAEVAVKKAHKGAKVIEYLGTETARFEMTLEKFVTTATKRDNKEAEPETASEEETETVNETESEKASEDKPNKGKSKSKK